MDAAARGEKLRRRYADAGAPTSAHISSINDALIDFESESHSADWKQPIWIVKRINWF